MTPLAGRIAARIRAAGPLTIAQYMTECLTDPAEGYYTTREPFGRGGDFTTAPEISQMFGELIGLCLAQSWLEQGAPARFVLAEAGPGRGTLMADILRATLSVPGFHDALRLVLVEISPALRARQAETIGNAARPEWVEGVGDLPDGPLYLVANEFLDALPIRQFVRKGGAWAERVVGLRDGALAFGLTDAAPVAALAHRLGDTHDGDIVETCAQAEAVASQLAQRIAAQGGMVLFVDYGGWRSLGDTFQAVADHAPADPLAAPGQADLTAHVAFEPLAQAARTAGAATSAMIPQGVFLERLGITARAQALARGLSGAALETHIAAHRRLTHPEEMGDLFKAMSIHPKNHAPPPGLEP